MELRIRVGAAVDRSMSEAFRPLIKSAEQARAALETSAKRAASSTAKTAAKAASDESRAYAKAAREIERWEREKARLAERSARERQKSTEAAARAEVQAAERASRERARIEARERAATERAARARAREELAVLREVERAAGNGGGGGRGGASGEGRRSRGRSSRFLSLDHNLDAAVNAGGRALGAGVGVARSVAQGMGVSFDLASYVNSGVRLEKAAVDLTNAGYMPGQAGPNGQRQDPAALMEQMRSVGNAAGFDPTKAIEGLQKFVAKTGDLQTGRDLMADIAKYARASGAELDDMVDAAGDVKNALGENGGPEQVKSVMRAIAAQGKEGAVEIKDLATQMAKLGAASSQFTGDGAFVMAQMGALAQMTRAKGGAASATQAATAVGSFTNTFSKGARLDAFKAFGVDILGKDNKVDLKKTILGSIKAASSEEHGGMAQFNKNMGKMFMDVAARRVTRGFETVYKEAGGGDAGLKAVEKALDDLTNSTMNEKEIADSFNASMNTTEAKVQLFNNQMAETSNELKSVLLPAFQGLAPVILDLTKKSVDWLAKITGTKDAEAQKNQHSVEMRALNASTALRAAGEKDSIADGDVQKLLTDAAEAKKALEVQIAAKASQVGEESAGFAVAGSNGRRMTDEDIGKLAAGGDINAEKYLRDKQELSSMKDTLDRLTRQSDDLADKLAQKTLRVVLVGDTRAPTLTLDAIGRQDPPEKKKR